MDVQFGEYATKLYNEGVLSVFSGDVPKAVNAIAEAGNLYPIEAIISSIALGILGSIFGGMILTPIIFIAVSLFTTAAFCKETEVFMDRVKRAYNHPSDTAGQRAQNLAALREAAFQRTHSADLKRAQEFGFNLAGQYAGQSFQDIIRLRAAVRLQSVFRGHRQRRDFRLQRSAQRPPPPPPIPPRSTQTLWQRLKLW